MEQIEIFQELSKYGLFALIAGWVVWYLLGQLKKKELELQASQSELKDYSKDYREMSMNSLKVLTLVDDKLKNDLGTNESIKDIHRMVSRLVEIQEKRG